MMMFDNVKVPLKWPEGWARTRLETRQSRKAWTKNLSQSLVALEKELKRLGATSWEITHNEIGSPDSGVAVWLTLKPVNEYSWQDVLGFVGEVPTVKQIDQRYMELAKKVHVDGPTPDRAVFEQLTKARDNARAWARGEQNVPHDRVIALDAFKELRWNVNAVRMVLFAMRQIERCGAPVMMDRAWRGFAKQITAGDGRKDVVTA